MSDISAFPYVIPSPNGRFEWAERGMTLRDYFAGQVLKEFVENFTPEDAAKYSYRMADAMIKEREIK